MPVIVSLAGENPFSPSTGGIQMKVLLKGSFWGGGLCVTVVVVILGFTWGGWTLGSTVEKLVEESRVAGALAVQVPICVHQGRDAPVEVRRALKAESSWTRGDSVEVKGWATMPDGSDLAAPGVASPCAEALVELYSQQPV